MKPTGGWHHRWPAEGKRGCWTPIGAGGGKRGGEYTTANPRRKSNTARAQLLSAIDA